MTPLWEISETSAVPSSLTEAKRVESGLQSRP